MKKGVNICFFNLIDLALVAESIRVFSTDDNVVYETDYGVYENRGEALLSLIKQSAI